MKCDFLSSKSEKQDLVSKQFSFQSSLFLFSSLSSFSIQKIILLFGNAKPPAATMCVVFDGFGTLWYIRLLYSLWFVLLVVKLKSSLIFILCIHTTRASRVKANQRIVGLFSHHVFHSIKFIFFSSVCYPWLKLVWCVHSTYKPDLIFIFVDKFVNSGWPVKLGMMKTT